MPFFSVVIPVYNRADMIAATVNSVLAQSFNDYELIIVNDGSTDNSEEVVKDITGENDKVKYIKQENKERGAARNKGFRNSSGVYVVFLDSDDLMHSDHLAILHKEIGEQNFPNFIATKYFLKRDNEVYTPAVLKSLPEGDYDIDLALKGSPFGVNFAVKRENPRLHLFVEDRKYAVIEDWMFIAQNLNHDRIYIVDATTITMNDHDARSMRGDHQDIINKHILATDWIENNIDLTTKQKKILWGYSYHFCATHGYIDGNRKASFSYLLKAIRFIGIDYAKVELLVKNIFGYKLIQSIKK